MEDIAPEFPPPGHQSLPVLPSSNKVEQFKEDFAKQSTPEPAPQTSPAPLAPAPGAHPAPPPPSGFGSHPMHKSSPDSTPAQRALEATIVEVIRTVYDPEIPINIYELGLIYEIDVDAENRVKVKMTLTAPGCPVAGSLPVEVERKIEAIPEVKSADVELVWDPPWDKARMSEAALLDLGLV
jgi:FeS assembly SUF system protein